MSNYMALDMKEKLPINPDVLIWARESANLLIEDVAHKMNKSQEAIESWEKGDSSPTYIQLETLAYTLYKRPVAVFFFPKPPEEITAQNSFRTLPESEVEELGPRFMRVFRRAQAMQINLEELTDGNNPASKKIFMDLSFEPRGAVVEMAETVRQYLGIDIKEQVGWSNTEAAFEKWRSAVENSGIFVFKNAFRDDEISGFCIYDSNFPVIYINNSMPKTRQIFTLFHELTHLLFKTGGIDKQNDAYLRKIHGDDKRIEILCNRFVGEFLLPKKEFNKVTSSLKINSEAIETLANRYKVSREVILRKCLDKGLIDQAYYEKWSTRWIKEARRKAKERSGGNYYGNVASYLGDSYLNLVFSNFYQKRFPTDQLAEYLGVKATSIPGLEMAFFGRG
jgi:Zn-dependent peptidase ImmA (M78 family)/transcriptional regulator with XRE-family HTH domain